MRTGVIVQARNSSTRYPNKMLRPLGGRPAIDRVLERCEKISANHRILATSEGKDDDILAEIAEKKGWSVVRGSLEDVLARFAKAVRIFGLDRVVRITGDCVLTDYRIVNHAIERFDESKPDYLTLTGIIDGFDVEVMSGQAIVRAEAEARLPSEREHVATHIRTCPSFKTILLPYEPRNLSHIHLSLDYQEDAEVLEGILQHFMEKDFTYDDVARLVTDHPKLIERTRHISPNEGYQRSLEMDRAFIRGLKGKPLPLAKSAQLFDRVIDVIPNGSQTFSKSHLQFSRGASPLFVTEGTGCSLTDVDGNRFIDYSMGLGACLLGYAFGPVTEAITRQLAKGSTYTLPHALEYELAELLTHVIPCAEMVRFGKNGSDVTSAAVRLARAYTGRDVIACCGYHGWQDWYIATTTRGRGIPDAVKRLTVPFTYNDLASLERVFADHTNQVAAVIMEPVSLEAPRDGFLARVKDLVHRNGAVLIFDEVVTGFRFATGGAQELFGVTPDLACLGKAMANGMPISALVGRREVMRLLDEVFFSFTFGGETLSIASALATIRYLVEHKVTNGLARQGTKLKDGIQRLIRDKCLGHLLSIQGYPVRTVLSVDADEKQVLKIKTLIQQEAAKRGLLFTGGHNLALPHDDGVIERGLAVYAEVMDIVRYAVDYQMLDEMIEGRLLEPVFRRV